MDALPPEQSEPQIDALLRRARPEPDPQWVRDTEARLLPERPQRSWFPMPQVRLGAVFAVGLAILVLGLSLAGVGPLGASNEPVVADDDCRTVQVTRTERVPRIVERPGAEPQIVYENRRVQRLERRCD